MARTNSRQIAEFVAGNFATAMGMVGKKMLQLVVRQKRRVQVFSDGELQEYTLDDDYADAAVEVNMSGAMINSDKRIADLSALLTMAKDIAEKMGPDNPLLGAREVGNIIREMAQAMGFRNTSRFIGEPSKETMDVFMAQRAEEAQAAEGGAEQLKMQAEIQKAQIKAEVDTYKINIDAQVELIKAYAEAKLAEERTAAEERLKEMEIKQKERIESKKIDLTNVRPGGKVG